MSWPIRYHAERPERPQVGDMWPAPWLVRAEHAPGTDLFLSEAYRAGRAAGTVNRMPLVVRLPGPTDFCVDGPFHEGAKTWGGWAVTGEPPAITLTPSINIVGSYHGFITAGVISDDCEGRKFS